MCRVTILTRMPSPLGRDRLTTLLRDAARTRIVAVGDAMLDEYLVGDVERISPEAPVPVVRIRERRHALGGAANVAQNIVAVGAGYGFDAVTVRSVDDLAEVRSWVDGDRARPLLLPSRAHYFQLLLLERCRGNHPSTRAARPFCSPRVKSKCEGRSNRFSIAIAIASATSST